jgi:hypothetical protein
MISDVRFFSHCKIVTHLLYVVTEVTVATIYGWVLIRSCMCVCVGVTRLLCQHPVCVLERGMNCRTPSK